MSSPLLSLRVRSLRWGGRLVLHDVAMDVHRGEIVGVAGHVGAGKTTLGLLAASLLHRSANMQLDAEVRRGELREGAPPAGYQFANPWTQLTGWGATVREEVAVGPENLNIPTARLREIVSSALQRAGAAHLADRSPLELSGGELQRVALASSLAMQTPLLVLDEPTSQLDSESVADLTALLPALAREGHGIVLIEQDLDLLAAVCHRVVVVSDGGVIATGDAAELLGRWPPLDPRLGTLSHVQERAEPPVSRTVVVGSARMLTVRDLRVGYGRGPDVLNDVSLEIPLGSIAAWMGPNGSGKSTLARAIMGLVPARAGSVAVSGETLDDMPVEARARHVGLVFQDPGKQLFAASVLDEVAFGPRVLGWSRERARAAAREALRLVELADHEGAHPGDLSPQERRFVAIASALAAGPPLLILDEPTAGQDARGRETLARVLDVQRDRGAAAIITHDAGVASRQCDQVHRFGVRGRAGGVTSAAP